MQTILLVEDSRTDQRLITSLLEQAGFKVTLAETAEIALHWLAGNQCPDLILIDIVMPEMNGLEFCREVRTNPLFKSIPIVFCSSKDQEFDRFWALRQGGNAYITKPFEPEV